MLSHELHERILHLLHLKLLLTLQRRLGDSLAVPVVY